MPTITVVNNTAAMAAPPLPTAVPPAPDVPVNLPVKQRLGPVSTCFVMPFVYYRTNLGWGFAYVLI